MSVSRRLAELLRSQVPNANVPAQSNPFVEFLTDLSARVDVVDGLMPRIISLTITGQGDGEVGVNDTLELGVTVVAQNGASEDVTWSLTSIVYANDLETGVSINAGTGVVTVADEEDLIGTTMVAVVTSDFDEAVSSSVALVVVA